MGLFGFSLTRDDKTKLGDDLEKSKTGEDLQAFAISRDISSEAVIPEGWYPDGGMSSVPYEIVNTPSDEQELIQSYRNLASQAEIDEALQEIRNEVFIFDVPDKRAFELQFKDESKISKGIQKKVSDEFHAVYEIMNFDYDGYQLFDDWYVDSKLYVHKIIDKENSKEGIKKCVVIDPLRIRLVRILPKRDPVTGVFDISKVQEFYIYNNTFDPKKYPMNQPIQIEYGGTIQGLQISKDAISYINSGLYDRNLGRYVGYLKKSIEPYNMLKMMEAAMVIFRVVRAPARRAFFLDVSGMQKNKAEEYMKNTMAKFKNKMVFDTKTGSLSDRRNIMTMVEDYQLPRREGKSTDIQTIEGQNSNDIMDEIEQLRDKLQRSLGVPRGRFGDQQSSQLFGVNTELQRDEYRFTKFLHLLRSRFILLIEDILKSQLILKNIIEEDEQEELRHDIVQEYTEDNAFTEAKEINIINNRIVSLAQADSLTDKYFSIEQAQKNILRFSDDIIKKEAEKIKKEKQEMADTEDDPNIPQEPNAQPFSDTQEQ